ncbi:MAG: sugar phosphate isomerase/epimerase [Clostridia bacterium]|nr:sugar phosphate isomerase/epimerase [Clostridia bacterium]
MNLPLAIQLYSVRDDMERDFIGTIKKVKDLGYDGVEFAGLFGRTGVEVKAICDEIGIIPVSAHVPYYDMLENPEAVLKDYQEMGCKYVVVPYLTEECRPGTEGWAATVEGVRKIGEAAKNMGLQLLYHNHDFEFLKIDGEYALDILYNTIPADLLKTELDTCWVNVGGEEPAAYVEKYSGRAPIVHLKDFAGQKGNGPLYKLIGIEEEEGAKEENTFEFRPVGYGCQDWKKIIASAEKAGAEWVVVEQDDPSMDKTPLECAELSINYLKTI